MSTKKWIPENLKKGALHRALGIPEDQKIPMELINKKIKELQKKAEGDKKLSDSDQKLLKRLLLARTFKKMKHESQLESFQIFNLLKESLNENIS